MSGRTGYEFVDREGDEIVLQCRPRYPAYKKCRDARAWEHCYSCVPDQKGRFWVWSYKPVGKNARKGEPTEYVMVRPRWFRVRNKARRCAMDRAGLMCTPWEQMK